MKISAFLFNFLLSLYLFCINETMLGFIINKVDDNLSIFALLFMYFFLILSAVSILCVCKISRIIFTIILTLAAISSNYFMNNYSVVIDFDMLNNVISTDSREIKDLLSFKMFAYFSVNFIFVIIFLFAFKVKKNTFSVKILNIILPLIIVCVIFFLNSRAILPFLRANDNIRYYNVPFYQIYAAYKLADFKLQSSKPLEKISEDALIKDDDKSKILILVVGETARWANYSLGKYTKNDTNFYTKQESPYFFNNFYSCGTATATSLPCMFSISKREEFSKKERYENVLSVLNRFIDVYWFDNNSGGCKGVCNGLKELQQSLDYDYWLVDKAKESLNNNKAKNLLIVLHLQGSHGPSYYLRYPKEFEKFTPTCKTSDFEKCSKEELINTYDNTIYYTDYIIYQLIQLLKESKADVKSLFYLSDHGESLGEAGLYLHGFPYSIAPDEQKHIPALLWTNYDYINKDKLNYSLSQDNLFSSLLGFFNIQTKDYEENYDIFSKNLGENE
ncbi:phosphoethanolamine--lipid A transferase [Campylobacter canadensis]|uniref:phosphoethanolamine transferase n=1 Tax=Campylobacter canadensis TaxID=449520 RepID=UPI00155474D6|nr:phosphoethanolamine--lipid A transferase [Campylobacter canadensis]MBZ7994250.1 phosphoethanolamine--lipid A transferase [Campylobacter canadensis]MBZ7995758.1 phosphoethanolamine--lipid A transferase [Campylobacter canadensis]MBZ7999582.1 phosphoethanolamine--lipid A transferase [Campylobacter canadensis]MBZ8001331.1 phosphoethanolamine--lipid A transferase [Campylobacter canadensis]MBZ8004272.1 phosphoethanolamine--lipid A transferase [Campylobacter canadensis]